MASFGQAARPGAEESIRFCAHCNKPIGKESHTIFQPACGVRVALHETCKDAYTQSEAYWRLNHPAERTCAYCLKPFTGKEKVITLTVEGQKPASLHVHCKDPYVKSNRPICRGCDKTIVHDVLMVTMPGHKKSMPMCTRCAAKAAKGQLSTSDLHAHRAHEPTHPETVKDHQLSSAEVAEGAHNLMLKLTDPNAQKDGFDPIGFAGKKGPSTEYTVTEKITEKKVSPSEPPTATTTTTTATALTTDAEAEAEDPYEPALPSKQLSVAVASKPSTDDAPEGRLERRPSVPGTRARGATIELSRACVAEQAQFRASTTAPFSAWTCVQVAAWLHSKGAKFEGFETAVIENDITGALLLEQIKQDELAIVFEDLGVSSRLQQKSILADIHKFIEEEHVVK